MPRRPPLTNRDVAEREKFGFGARAASADEWDFSKELDDLGIVKAQDRRAGQKALATICNQYYLMRLVEDQETAARKAEAFQRADRWHTRRTRALHRYNNKAAKPHNERAKEELEEIAREARHVLGQPWITPALEQEAIRMQQSEGLSLKAAFIRLRDEYRGESKAGRKKSYALLVTVHRLQAFASQMNQRFAWSGRIVPPQLVGFLIAVLEQAKIPYPSYQENPSKFRRLMITARRTVGLKPEQPI